MSYAKIESGAVSKYPYNLNDLKKDNPLISFPKTYLSQAASNGEYNVVEVIAVAAPVEEGKTAEEETPVLVGSNWTQKWKLVTDPVDDDPRELPWWEKRLKDYGHANEQLEYLVENGVDAFVTRQEAIKAKYPKS